MPVDLVFIEELIALVGRSPILELDLSQDGWRLRLVKAPGGVPQAVAPPPDLVPSRDDPSPAQTHVVAAGLVGTFYRGPSPDKPPFVAVGDRVADGQTLGLVEAMKTLIPIEADRAGRIGAILRENGASVQAGDPLFTIEPVDEPCR